MITFSVVDIAPEGGGGGCIYIFTNQHSYLLFLSAE